MIKLFKIETFKLFKRMKTWVVIIAFMLLTALIGYGIHSDAENAKRYNSPEARIADMQRIIESEETNINIIPEEIKNNAEKVAQYKKDREENIENMKNEIAALKAMQIKGTNWRENVKGRIKALEVERKNFENAAYEVQPSQKESVAQEIEKLQYLLDKDVEPIEEYEFNAFNFMIKLIQILGEVFLAIGIAVFVADMVSGEATPPTMKLLLTQPVSRAKVLFSKFMSISLSSIVCIVGVELLAFLVIGIFFGFGNADYPMFAGTRYQFDTTQLMENGTYPLVAIAGSTHMMPMWQYVIKLVLLQSLFIVTCVSVIFLISTLVKSSMVSMGISVVSIIASMIVFMGFNVLRQLGRFVFVLFGDVNRLLTGQQVFMFNDPRVTVTNTCIMLAAWTVISYAIAHIVFTKKDILI